MQDANGQFTSNYHTLCESSNLMFSPEKNLGLLGAVLLFQATADVFPLVVFTNDAKLAMASYKMKMTSCVGFCLKRLVLINPTMRQPQQDVYGDVR